MRDAMIYQPLLAVLLPFKWTFIINELSCYPQTLVYSRNKCGNASVVGIDLYNKSNETHVP